MSRRGCDGGRKKGVIDSRRGVNCPVSDCDVSVCFYKHVMQQQHWSRRFGMKAIVETLATDNVKKFYSENKHSALGDAETLCKLSYSRLLHDRFRNWVICFQSLIGPTDVNLERKRSQSVQRFIPDPVGQSRFLQTCDATARIKKIWDEGHCRDPCNWQR